MPIFGGDKEFLKALSIVETVGRQVEAAARNLSTRFDDPKVISLLSKASQIEKMLDEREASIGGLLATVIALDSKAGTALADLNKQVEELKKVEKQIFAIRERAEKTQEVAGKCGQAVDRLLIHIEGLKRHEAEVFSQQENRQASHFIMAELATREAALKDKEGLYNDIRVQTVDSLKELEKRVQTLEALDRKMEKESKIQRGEWAKLQTKENELKTREATVSQVEVQKDQLVADLEKTRSVLNMDKLEFQRRRNEEAESLGNLEKELIRQKAFLSSFARRLTERHDRLVEQVQKVSELLPKDERPKFASEILPILSGQELRQLQGMSR